MQLTVNELNLIIKESDIAGTADELAYWRSRWNTLNRFKSFLFTYFINLIFSFFFDTIWTRPGEIDKRHSRSLSILEALPRPPLVVIRVVFDFESYIQCLYAVIHSLVPAFAKLDDIIA